MITCKNRENRGQKEERGAERLFLFSKTHFFVSFVLAAYAKNFRIASMKFKFKRPLSKPHKCLNKPLGVKDDDRENVDWGLRTSQWYCKAVGQAALIVGNVSKALQLFLKELLSPFTTCVHY